MRLPSDSSENYPDDAQLGADALAAASMRWTDRRQREPINTEIIHEACKQSVANSLPFPDLVRRLTEAGVESYYADLIV